MLKKYFPYEYAESVFAIDYAKLYKSGFRGIIFDVDNTLVHHGDDSNERVDNFFRQIQDIGFKTVLLSDNDKDRIERFIKNISTPYVCDAQKPNTDSFLKAVKILGCDKSCVICIGDQIFTDILGANNSGIKNILVKFIRLPEETKIGKKRQVEKIVLKLYKMRKSQCHRLGDILLKEGM